jgi:hypothetical protein
MKKLLNQKKTRRGGIILLRLRFRVQEENYCGSGSGSRKKITAAQVLTPFLRRLKIKIQKIDIFYASPASDPSMKM